MSPDEITGAITYAQNLWPDWTPNLADLDSWRRVLVQVATGDAACRAFRQMKDQSDWNTPKRREFHEAFRAGANRPMRAAANDSPLSAYCGWWVQCIAFPQPTVPNQVNRLGQFSTVTYAHGLPEPHVVAQHFEDLRKTCEGIYGGTWQTIRGDGFEGPPQPADLYRWREELRAEAGLPKPQPLSRAKPHPKAGMPDVNAWHGWLDQFREERPVATAAEATP